jgi:Family of unknown function (DUF6623)
MIRSAVWIHGTSVQAEYPVPSIARKGWGTQVIGNPSIFVSQPAIGDFWSGPASVRNWFHFALTTPVILDDVRPRLARCFVLFFAQQAWVRAVHLWDANQKVAEFDTSGFNFTGDWMQIAPENTFSPPQPLTIAFGLGISVGVDFERGQIPIEGGRVRMAGGEILFTTVGADFEP